MERAVLKAGRDHLGRSAWSQDRSSGSGGPEDQERTQAGECSVVWLAPCLGLPEMKQF